MPPERGRHGAMAPCPPPGVLILRIPETPSTSPCLARLLLLRIDGTQMPRDDQRALIEGWEENRAGNSWLFVDHIADTGIEQNTAPTNTEPDPLRHLPPADQCETSSEGDGFVSAGRSQKPCGNSATMRSSRSTSANRSLICGQLVRHHLQRPGRAQA